MTSPVQQREVWKTSEKVAFDYTLQTDGVNNQVVCPTPSPSSSSFTITLPTIDPSS